MPQSINKSGTRGVQDPRPAEYIAIDPNTGLVDAKSLAVLNNSGVSGGSGGVTSVAGRTGVVTLTTSDVSGLGNVATHALSEFALAAQGTRADNAQKSNSISVTTDFTVTASVSSIGASYINNDSADHTLTIPAGLNSFIINRGPTNNLSAVAGAGVTFSGTTSTNYLAPSIKFVELSSGVYRGTPVFISYDNSGGPAGGIVVNNLVAAQNAHDTLKALGGGTLIFDPSVVYTFTDATVLRIDTHFVSCKFNKATFDISSLSTTVYAITFYGSVLLHNMTGYYGKVFNREYTDLYIYGGDPLTRPNDATPGTNGVLFDSTLVSGGDHASNRMQLVRPVIVGCYTAINVKSGSYVIRIRDGHITRNRYGINQVAGGVNVAEIVAFEDMLFGENGIHLYDLYSNVWKFTRCHMDYHMNRLCELTGSNVTFTDCHFEWSYGKIAGDTNCPFKYTGSGANIYIKGSRMVYSDSTGQNNPYYPAIFDMSNNDHVLDIENIQCLFLGRQNDTAGFDAWVYVPPAAGIVIPQIKIRSHAAGVNFNHIPSMTMYVDPGVAGQCIGGTLRNANDPQSELGWCTQTTGTAKLTSVAVDENGVTRKNLQNMWRIEGQGKVLINFPNWEPTRRHAWQFFTATSTTGNVFAGTATIKERQGGCSIVFSGVAPAIGGQAATISIGTPGVITSALQVMGDERVSFTTTGALPTGLVAGQIYYVLPGSITGGTFQVSATQRGTAIATSGTQSGVHTATLSYTNVADAKIQADSRGAQYGAATVSITTPNATWVRRNWKSCTDRPVPRLPLTMARSTPVEIDTTGMTSGYLYISHPAFDII